MGREEQQEEREVLDSIFPDEIQDISDTGYRISISLDVQNESDDDDTPPPIILLNVRYPEAYPDEAPMLDITTPHNAEKHPQLDVQEDKARLLDALQPAIEENMGMAMIFTLVSTLKDAAELLITERKQAVQALRDVEIAKAEEEENRKFEGQKVTRETFLAWKERFDREMAAAAQKRKEELEAEERKKRGGKAEERKMTGKQLWLSGLAGKVADEEDVDGEDAVEGMRSLTVEG